MSATESEQPAVTPLGHGTDAVTPVGHEPDAVTPVGHEPDAVTPVGHEPDAVTPLGHELGAVTANGHSTGDVTPESSELDDVTLERIKADLRGLRKRKRRRSISISEQWPRHKGWTAGDRQRFRRARLNLGIKTPQQLRVFLETHASDTLEWRYLQGKGPFTPAERALYHLGPETAEERSFWGTHTDEEKATRRRATDTARQRRHRAKTRRAKIPADEVDIISPLLEQVALTEAAPTKAA
jgi:hypothetical protein